jgi:cobalt/nickel transport system permease protein
MHMADALLSPTVGVGFLVASGGVLAYCAKRVQDEGDDRKIPLMGVLGAFVFAAQMINFTIPGTGSSGHIGGGMLLAMLLGPYGAFVTMTSVLIVQALIFADGGILALGTNIWNLGFYPCLLGWWIYRMIVGKNPAYARLSIAAMLGILVAVEMGAFSVAVQTVLSGKSELPLGEFSVLMLGIHLPIGLVEGFVTLSVVNFVYRIRPQVVRDSLGIGQAFEKDDPSYKPLFGVVLISTLLIGGVFAWFASSLPDGLEWSLQKILGPREITETADEGGGRLARLQEQTAPLPGYDIAAATPKTEGDEERAGGKQAPTAWPHVSGGKSLSGIVGSLAVLACVCFTALVLVRLRSRQTQNPQREPPE